MTFATAAILRLVLPRRGRYWSSPKRSMRSRGIMAATGRPRFHDHHAKSAANHTRRWRHRPALLLHRTWRVPDRGGDRSLRLRDGDAAFLAWDLFEVLQAGTRRVRRRGR